MREDWVTSDCLTSAWHLPDVCLPKVSLKLSDICLMTTLWWLPYDFWLPQDDCLRTPWRLPDNWLTTITTWGLLQVFFLKNTWQEKERQEDLRLVRLPTATSSLKLDDLKDISQALTTSHNSKLTGYISTYKPGIIILP